jgi:hypothetical protein
MDGRCRFQSASCQKKQRRRSLKMDRIGEGKAAVEGTSGNGDDYKVDEWRNGWYARGESG